ncbi:XapX domain-containing protein [Halobiforma lacisalsi AJ5]|uniref:XapX domain-containing protein n=2 Tax=Natronobacterium TaxID=2256 RepID=M0LRA5_NATLA|nr:MULTISPECIES: DUF1427 family protein [Halobiforma]APW99702.1 XapX domain-containing protein [Halobiforma lacisalsi AJ5]EMA36127.1 XapX domain-containing protein [Halobiforma lacisalsi AJ5]SFC10841.1 XapX domain-containing protein [Halobiforma haloterrestris]
MNYELILLGLATGAATGGFFALFDVPIPAPPELPGLMGIVGIYLGYKLVDAAGITANVSSWLGL